MPGAIAATAVLWGINFVLDWIVTWFLSWIPVLGWLYIVWFFFDVLALSGFAGTAFVVTGAVIAPNHHKIVANLLSGLAILITGAGLFGLLSTHGLKWYAVVSALLFLLGAGNAALRFEDDPSPTVFYE